MFNMLFDNTSLPALQQVLAFSEHRQKTLVHNIANITTPGFRASDLPVEEFIEALSGAIERRDETTPHRFEMRSTRHIKFGRRMQVQAEPVGGLMNYYDGADRSVERMQSEVLKNHIWHKMAAKLFIHQSSLLETAIRERVT